MAPATRRTVGATEAIAAAVLALLEPGDEVIAFEPFYDPYAVCIAMAGARRVPLTLIAPDFRPDLDELRQECTSAPVTISSAGRIISFTGWKVGWVKALSPAYWTLAA